VEHVSDSLSAQTAQTRFMLARAWHSRGTPAAAIAGYREVLALEPAHLEAALGLGALMHENMRLREALGVYRQALEHHPNEARLHKQLVNVLLALEGPDAVFREYALIRKDARVLSLRSPEILCCIVLRNESARLPYFLEYYRKKGIGAFFAVDNGSSDGSLEYLLKQPDVYVWESQLSFNRANFGSAWFEPILRMYGQRHWCLIVDADELLYYPDCERRSIEDLCRQLDSKRKRVFHAILLDMYSDQPVRDTRYTPGQPFEDVCPYFDRRFYHTVYPNAGPFNNQNAYFGGVRQRIFGEAGQYYLSKAPLLRYDADCILAGGQHWTNLQAEWIASETGCLLHFKYFSSFHDYVSQETLRKEHYGGAMQYQEYERGLREEQRLNFYHPAHSVRLEDSSQLIRLGVMQADESAATASRVEYPKIDPVPAGSHRPLWSVMLTVYRRTRYLEQALGSVLAQAPGSDEMQIEIVSDGPDDPAQSEVEWMVRSIAGERVTFHRHPSHAGHPEIFNICLRRARGFWVHILHDDDWVAPGFYQALQGGIMSAPDIGAAFCRHAYVDDEGRSLRLSFLERETPGTIEDWLARIGGFCRLQTPSIAVRREAYERVGGYVPQARSAFDWEMWQRLAVHYPVWYEPKALAFFREGSQSESAHLIASGQQTADTRAVIDLARDYLPRAVADAVSRRAGEHYAVRALELAARQMEAGDLRAALANFREGIQCSQSTEVIQRLFSMLLRAKFAQK
jgi:glycosyltransferase involved in cell wall biosynthesis